MQKTIRTIVLFFMLLSQTGMACELGMHDWQRVFLFDVPLSGPLTISREVEIINVRFMPSEVSEVVLSAPNLGTAFWGLISRNYLPELWPNALPWRFMPTAEVKPAEIAPDTLLLNLSKYRLRIMLFRDRLSDNRCHQLVIMQEGRFRLAMPNAKRPIAEEYNPIAWVSLMYYDFPTLSQIMSLSFSPVRGQLSELYLNLDYVEYLLTNMLVIRRVQEYIPEVEGFPMPID